jgi:IclR family pca regulon transcriptional regulator
LPKDSDFVGSLARGLSVIEAFGTEQPRMTLTDMARRCDMTRASARRFLLTLTELGYARSDGRYFELTPRVLQLGFSYLSGLGFAHLARPYLGEVTRALNESCSAAVMDGMDIVYVARSAAPHRIMSVSLDIGARLPAYATSMGQVLLSELPGDELEAYLGAAQLIRRTRRTLTDGDALRRRLKSVKRHGYALVDQEMEEGLRSLAVPVRNGEGRASVALNVSTHASRVPKAELLRDYLPLLKRTAQEIAQASLVV